MIVPFYLAIAGAGGGSSNQAELLYILERATPEGKVIIVCLFVFSLMAWTVMIQKALQMRRAKKLNLYFNAEFRSQSQVLGMFDRKLKVDGCPLFVVYEAGSF